MTHFQVSNIKLWLYSVKNWIEPKIEHMRKQTHSKWWTATRPHDHAGWSDNTIKECALSKNKLKLRWCHYITPSPSSTTIIHRYIYESSLTLRTVLPYQAHLVYWPENQILHRRIYGHTRLTLTDISIKSHKIGWPLKWHK